MSWVLTGFDNPFYPVFIVVGVIVFLLSSTMRRVVFCPAIGVGTSGGLICHF